MSNKPNAKKVAISVICKYLSELEAENKVHLIGQLILAVDDDTGQTGIKRGDWDPDKGDITTGTPFNERPWIVSPAQSGSDRLNVFSVENTDDNYDYIDPNADYPNGAILIDDVRLFGSVNYPVICTQFGGGAIRKENLQYDGPGGRVYIKGEALQDGETIWITLPMGLQADPGISALVARIEACEVLLSAFKIAGGALIPWRKPKDQIPAGFREVEDWRGRLLMHYDPLDDQLKNIGQKYGAKTQTMTSETSYPHAHHQSGESLYEDYKDGDRNDNGTDVGERIWEQSPKPPGAIWPKAFRKALTEKVLGWINPDNQKREAKPFSILNPVKIAMYIELIPAGEPDSLLVA